MRIHVNLPLDPPDALNLLVRIAELEIGYDHLRRRLDVVEGRKPPARKKPGPKPKDPPVRVPAIQV